MNEKGSLLYGKDCQFELVCLFWPIVCSMRGLRNYIGHILSYKIYKRIIQKVRTLKITTFWPNHLACILTSSRSSHRMCSLRKSVLRNFAKFTGPHLCQSLFFNKVAGLRPEHLFFRTPPDSCFFRSWLCFPSL